MGGDVRAVTAPTSQRPVTTVLSWTILIVGVFLGLCYSVIYKCDHLEKTSLEVSSCLWIMASSPLMMKDGFDQGSLELADEKCTRRVMIPIRIVVTEESLVNGTWKPQMNTRAPYAFDDYGMVDLWPELRLEEEDIFNYLPHDPNEQYEDKGSFILQHIPGDEFNADGNLVSSGQKHGSLVPLRHYMTEAGFRPGDLPCFQIEVTLTNVQLWDVFGQARLRWELKSMMTYAGSREDNIHIQWSKDSRRHVEGEFVRVRMRSKGVLAKFSWIRLIIVTASYSFVVGAAQAFLVFVVMTCLPKREEYNDILQDELKDFNAGGL